MIGWEKRLKSLLAEMQSDIKPDILTVAAISAYVRPPSEYALIVKAAELVGKGKLKIAYRVISPETKVVVREFEQLSDIPDYLFDESADAKFRVVTNRDVEMVFKALRGNQL